MEHSDPMAQPKKYYERETIIDVHARQTGPFQFDVMLVTNEDLVLFQRCETLEEMQEVYYWAYAVLMDVAPVKLDGKEK